MKVPSFFDELNPKVDTAFRRLAEYGFAELTKFEQTLICIWAFKGEVENGGFDQFFFNSSGDYAVHVPDALRQIGSEAAALIVEAALTPFPHGQPDLDRQTRIRQLEALPASAQELFSRLEEEFSHETDGLDELLLSYVRRHDRYFPT